MQPMRKVTLDSGVLILLSLCWPSTWTAPSADTGDTGTKAIAYAAVPGTTGESPPHGQVPGTTAESPPHGQVPGTAAVKPPNQLLEGPVPNEQLAKLAPELRVVLELSAAHRTAGGGPAPILTSRRELAHHFALGHQTAQVAVPRIVTVKTPLRVIVDTNQPAELTSAGAVVRAFSGGVAAALVPAGRLADLVRLDSVTRVSLPAARRTQNDLARADSRVRDAARDYGVMGRGTTVAIIDSGIDFRDPSFLDAHGNTRIRALLDLSAPGDVDGDGSLDGTGPGGGTEYTAAEIDQTIRDFGRGRAKVYRWQRGPEDIRDNGWHESRVLASPSNATIIETLYVRVRIWHGEIGQLSVHLTAPDGRQFTLLTAQPQTASSLHAYYSVDGLTGTSTAGEQTLRSPPTDLSVDVPTGTITANEWTLSSLHAHYLVDGLTGTSTAGEWTLRVHDTVAGETGRIDGWALMANTVVLQDDLDGHGSHVAGVAAGDDAPLWQTDPGPLAGVAPEADLVVVRASRTMGATFDDDDQMAAIGWVDSYARSLAQPYVANYSLGTYRGARDGTDDLERFIDGLYGPALDGRAFVTAAGNDGNTTSHASGVLGPSAEEIAFQMGTMPAGDDIELWFEGPSDTRVGLRLPTDSDVSCWTTDALGEDRRQDCAQTGLGPGQIRYLEFFDARGFRCGIGSIAWHERSEHNGLFKMFLQLRFSLYSGAPGEWAILLGGAAGGWSGWSAAGAAFGYHGDGLVSVGSPATSRYAITVGSHVTRATWRDRWGDRQGYGPTLDALSRWSSRGPTRDGRMKPEVTAPGQWILSAASSQAAHSSTSLVDPRHVFGSGTSVASAHVAGVVALLQSMPGGGDLDAVEIRQLLVDAARADVHTGAVPNAAWGYGKLDAHAAVAEMAAMWAATSVPTHVTEPSPRPADTQTATSAPTLGPAATSPGTVEPTVEPDITPTSAAAPTLGPATTTPSGTTPERTSTPVGAWAVYLPSALRFDSR